MTPEVPVLHVADRLQRHIVYNNIAKKSCMFVNADDTDAAPVPGLKDVTNMPTRYVGQH